jgi:hypothetical protein
VHSTPQSEIERARLHQRLIDVMQANGTTPDEIRWPAVDELRPSPAVTVESDQEQPEVVSA